MVFDYDERFSVNASYIDAINGDDSSVDVNEDDKISHYTNYTNKKPGKNCIKIVKHLQFKKSNYILNN